MTSEIEKQARSTEMNSGIEKQAWSAEMNQLTAISSFLLILLAGVAHAQNSSNGSKSGTKATERGRYLVQIGGCNECHTPWTFDKALNMPVPNMSRYLSGHPADAPDPGGTAGKEDIGLIGPTFTSFKMPFGIVYAPNLTPDQDTGLGSWREAEFIRAMRTGKHFGGNGRAILPPMPWMNLAIMTDDDLKAVFAYLRSIPAIRNPVPEHKVPLPAIERATESFEKLKASLKAAGR